MANIVVSIEVTPGKGKLSASGEEIADFTYHPSTFICTRGDLIQWKCSQGPFALHFGERPLLGKTVIRSVGGMTAAGCHQTALLTVGKRAYGKNQKNQRRIPAGVIMQGTHEYAVAVHLEKGLKEEIKGEVFTLSPGVYIDACPGGGYEC
jgi:hypothetical protein